MIRLILALAALFTAVPALAAPARPVCGSIVVLRGDQGAWRPAPVHCPDARRITYDAARATFRSVYMLGASGVTLRGGTVDSGSAPNAYRAVAIDSSQNITIKGMAITGAAAGLVSNKSVNVSVLGNRFYGLGSDCIDFSGVQGGHVAYNVCSRDRMIGAEHPDGFQGIKTNGPNNDITVEHNAFTGAMQGVYFETGSAGRNIVVRGNTITTDFANGILINGATSASVTGNTVAPSTRARAGGVRPWVKATAGALTKCGNAVPAFPSAPEARACR